MPSALMATLWPYHRPSPSKFCLRYPTASSARSWTPTGALFVQPEELQAATRYCAVRQSSRWTDTLRRMSGPCPLVSDNFAHCPPGATRNHSSYLLEFGMEAQSNCSRLMPLTPTVTTGAAGGAASAAGANASVLNTNKMAFMTLPDVYTSL